MTTLNRNQNMGINTYDMDIAEAARITAYLKEGFLINNLDTGVFKVPADEVLAHYSEVLGVNPVVSENTYLFNSDKGTLRVILVPHKSDSDAVDSTFITSGILYGTEEVAFAIEAITAGKRFRAPRKEGVFSISIKHKYMTPMGIDYVTHYRNTENFTEIRDDFYPLINVPRLMELYSETKENILILTGAPGTGKTCFMKKCLREHALNKKRDIDVLYIKDREILKKDSFWADLTKRPPEVLVLDDLDDELLPRTEGRNEIVNNILSFSDGLFDVKTKIIITTNVKNSSIDSALIRPGRCFDILALPNLTLPQAITVWTEGFERTIEEFTEIFGNDDTKLVSQASLMSEYQRLIKAGAESYLLDTSISIRTVVQDGGMVNAE